MAVQTQTRTLTARLAAGLGVALLFATGASAQDAKPPVVKGGYAIHNTVDLGGHIANQAGSTAMYDTLVNIQSGPRVLGETLEMHAVAGKKHSRLFDSLYSSSNGFGGDPDNYVSLRTSKGKLYDFNGSFRRNRQYFDYNLLDNNLIPGGTAAPTSNGYVFPQQMDSPHLYNTVRRMTDLSLNLFPVSKVSVRLAYSKNIAQGPSYSSIHLGADAQLLQNWRNSTDAYTAAVDWKPLNRTVVTFQEDITHYKGDTYWQLAPSALNMQLASGTRVSLGLDNVTVPSCTGGAVLSNSTNPPTANPLCNGYISYTRSQPMRTLMPTEQIRFVSANIPKLHLNGNIRYTSGKMNVPNYYETFNGLESRVTTRGYTITASPSAQRINVGADIGAVYELSRRFTLSEQFSFSAFRQSSLDPVTETDVTGTSMAVAGTPGAPTSSVAAGYLGQRTATNNLTLAFQASPRASIAVGYRYRSRTLDRSITGAEGLMPEQIPDGATYRMNFHENGGTLGVELRPTHALSIGGNVEVMYADNSYVQTSPRALQHYKLRASYKPKSWANFYGTFNDLERRNNVAYVNHLDHNRGVSFGASIAPTERYSVEASYGYLDVFSQGHLCYADTPAGSTPVPAGTGCGSNPYLGTGYYSAPTQSGSLGFTVVPVKKLRTGAGYRVNSTSGHTETLATLRGVPGALQSQFMTPYANAAVTLAPAWIVKADWNYYDYNEQGNPVGPTAPRTFHGNVVTLGMHYEF
ncbi:MAG TPA: hypothetical protein VGB94_01600 [Acidobacteriaceae bacterium]